MPDTVLSNGVHIIQGGDPDWKPSMDINLTLFNAALTRVAAAESMHGGGIANYWPVPTGSTWAQAVAIIDQAGAAIGGSPPYTRQIVVLPNEPIIATSHKQLPPVITLCGSGPLSELIYQSNYTDAFGGSTGLRTTTGNIIRDFKITHDRAAMGSSGRLIAINTNAAGASGFNGTEVFGMTFQDITASAFVVSGGGNSLISFHHNVVNECWEQMLEINGPVDGLTAYNNVMVATNTNPVIAGTEPCGLFIGDEQGPSGDFKNIVFAFNDIDLTGIPGPEGPVNAFPCTLSDGGGSPLAWRYDKVVIANNIFRGGACGVRVQALRNAGAACTVSIIENLITDMILQGVQIGLSGDSVYLMHNTIHRPAGSSHAFWGQLDDSPVDGGVNFIEDGNSTIQD